MVKKGYRRNKEHQRKLNVSLKQWHKKNKDTKQYQDRNKRISESQKGRKRGPHSDETKKKISIRLKGNKSRLGQKVSEKQKAKQSKAMKGKTSCNKGVSMTEEQKQKIKQTATKNWQNPDIRKRTVAGLQKFSIKPEIRRNRSEKMKNKWKDEKYREHQFRTNSFFKQINPSYIEKIIIDLLQKYNIRNYIREKGFRIFVDNKIKYIRVDFFFPERNIIVEADGSQHEGFDCKEDDRKRDIALIKLGYNVIRFKSNQIINNIDWVSKEIQKVLFIKEVAI